MEHGHVELHELLWAAGWLVAVLTLFIVGLRAPLSIRAGRGLQFLYMAAVVLAAVGVGVLANLALTLHDAHIDLTREKIYTPSAEALAVVDELTTPVRITYFYRTQDPVGRRAAGLIEVMGRRNPLLEARVVDPDREPEAARREGVRLYNAAVIEAEGRRLLVESADESEIAIGVQRVLRKRAITVCFIEGHGELAMDGFEFHTHLEGVADHNHDDSSSAVVRMAGHGVGRLRRALEAQGYAAEKLVLATRGAVPDACSLVVLANPRTTFLPAESLALRRYLDDGGAMLMLLDLGFSLEPELARLVADLGARPLQRVIVDPLSHYQSDPEIVAVTGYDRHPVTQRLSLTFFPGARPFAMTEPAPGVTATAILTSSRDSYSRPVAAVATRTVELSGAQALAATGAAGAATAIADGTPAGAAISETGPQPFGVAAEGRLDAAGDGAPFRAVVIGDGDFASNSFLPYMANSDLLVAAVRWLAREDRGTLVRTRIPAPPTILLTAQQGRAVFGVIVVLMPLTVVAAGCAVWWRRR